MHCFYRTISWFAGDIQIQKLVLTLNWSLKMIVWHLKFLSKAWWRKGGLLYHWHPLWYVMKKSLNVYAGLPLKFTKPINYVCHPAWSYTCQCKHHMQSMLLVALHVTHSCWLQDKSFYILFGQVTNKEVDKFVVGKRVPSCQLRLEWVGTGQPVSLFHHVTLKGALQLPCHWIWCSPSTTATSTRYTLN